MKNKKILIVDDSEFNRALLIDILGEQYHVEEASNGEEAIEILRQNPGGFSLVLLDIVMPGTDGFTVLEYMGKYRMLENMAVIMISSDDSDDNIKKAYELGAFDYICRPFDSTVVHHRVANTMLLFAKQNRLEDLVMEQIYEQQNNNKLMISILSHIVEFRNGESGRHVTNVENITALLLRQLLRMTDRYPLSLSDITDISMASALHDIGKISLPSEILNKPGKLTKEEFEAIKTHTIIGSQMLLELSAKEREYPLVKTAFDICRWHHERYDGSGYPDGLVGDDIPISAQVVAMADVYDALTSDRCYKIAFPHEKAISMILRGECGSFNPLLLACLKRIQGKLKRLSEGQNFLDQEFETIQGLREKLKCQNLESVQRSIDSFTFEQEKSGFYAEVFHDVLFSYHCDTELLTLNSHGAEKFKLEKSIAFPKTNAGFQKVFEQQGVRQIVEAVEKASSAQPDIELNIMLSAGNEEICYHCVVKTIWTLESKPKQIGFTGVLLEIGSTDESKFCQTKTNRE